MNELEFASNLSPEIMATKLFVPRLRQEHVSRPRLIERLNQGLARQLILVSAPAGYGKSSLLSEWISQRGEARRTGPQVSFGWLSLDAGDNDLNRFLIYLLEALRLMDPVAGETALAELYLPKVTDVEHVLNAFINHFVGIAGEGVIILDDYHLIENQAVHEVLSLLIERLPPLIHMVVATRADPPLPLPRWRTQVLILQAVLLVSLGQEVPALSTFKRALEIGAPEGYVRIFLDAGQPVYELLRQLTSYSGMQADNQDYLNSLLASFVEKFAMDLQAVKAPGESLVEPLSPREMEVLVWMESTLSSSEIADKLFISVNTLRSHIKNIYAKLEVHNRRQAIQRAKELRLL